MNFLYLLFLCFLSCTALDAELTPSEECEKIKMSYERGFMTVKERSGYCLFQCQFLKVDCQKNQTGSPSFTLHRAIYNRARTLIDGVISGRVDLIGPDPFTQDDATVEAWMEMVGRTWGIGLCLIPIALNQWKYFNPLAAYLLMLIYAVVCMLGNMPQSVAIHNMLIALLAGLYPSNSSNMMDSIWTTVIMFGTIYGMFVVGAATQILLLFATITAFFLYLYQCFFKNRSGNGLNLVVAASQLCVLIEQLHYARDEMKSNTLAGVALELSLSAILPSGKSRYYLLNVSRISAVIVRFFDVSSQGPLVFVGVLLGQVVMFVSFRASLGTFYLYVLRYRTDVKSLAAGFYVYLIDWWGPMRCGFRLIFRLENFNTRRALYAILGFIIGYYEYRHAFEFCVVRVCLSTVDKLFIGSVYGRATHYLEVDFDFMQASFPQSGALPWMCVDELRAISSSTGRLLADKAGKTVGGLGVILSSGGRAMLYTVRHVVEGCKLVKFGSLTIADPDFRNITDASDPMVAMKVEVDDAPKVELLTRDEAYDVKHLVFINSTEEGNFICVVPDFKLVLGKLHATVNLRKGDSGGPCFAVLTSGELRLCGAVSQGNPRHGGGNIVSFCYHCGETNGNSSDEDSLGAVTQFNRVRRVSFASDDADSLRLSNCESLNDFIEDFRSDFEQIGNWARPIRWDDMKLNNDDLGAFLHAANYAEERRDDDRDVSDNDDSGAVRQSSSKRRKSKRKDKAFRKERGLVARILVEKLKQVYSLNDCSAIFDALMSGNIPKLGPRKYLQRSQAGLWIISDSLPEPDWT